MDYLVYVYEADSIESAGLPESSLEKGVDVEHLFFDRLTIDDARSIKKMSETRPVVASNRIFVIMAKSFSPEAQNALLKLLEEPPRDVQFYFVVPQIAVLLPTLRSRVTLIRSKNKSDASLSADFKTFLNKSVGERMEYVAKITKEKSLDEQEQFIRDCEIYAHQGLPKTTSVLREVIMARTYLSTPGASKKMVLESLTLSLGAK